MCIVRRKAIFFSIVALALAACAGSRESDAEVGALSSAITDCITTESRPAALAPVDLETAAQATIARCTREIYAFRAYFYSIHPGYRDYYHQRLGDFDGAKLAFARKFIATLRARG
jgi:hypothetical protein